MGVSSARAFRIIVNADDFGLSSTVNEAILQQMSKGVVTSTTVLANGPAVAESTKILQLFPNCSVGVHLNLTELQPLSNHGRRDLASILDGNGCFNGNAIRRVTITHSVANAVFREWCAQIENLIKLGVQPSHIDSHHHVHTIPRLLPVLAAIKKRFKIGKIRMSRNLYSEADRPGKYLLAGKVLYNRALRVMGFRTTGLFTDVQTFATDAGRFGLRPADVELMAHPGAGWAQGETLLLDTDWASVLGRKATLTSYAEL